MCVIDRHTLVYPQEIRKPQDKIIPCPDSVDGEPCSRSYIRDCGDHYVLLRSRSEGGYRKPPTYQIIEPVKYPNSANKTESVEPAKPRQRPNRRTINLDLWGIRMPWAKWSVRRETERRKTHITREESREANPFIVEPPERQACRSRSRSRFRPQYSSPIQDVRPKSPRLDESGTQPPPPPSPPGLSPSSPSPLRRHPRPPRERTPVSDRAPLRPRKASPTREPPIVIHHHRGDESPPLTPTREHRRQRYPGLSPQTDPIRHVNRSQDLRRQAEEDATRQPEGGVDYGHRGCTTDSRRADFADRDRRYAKHYRDERPLRSFAERQYDRIEQRGRGRYGSPLIIQEGRCGHRNHRERAGVHESDVRNSTRNRYGFPSGLFDRLRPRREYYSYSPSGVLPRRSSMPYGQKIVLDDDYQRSGGRWR